MIRIGDALILAGTKLRTRKVRTIVSVVTASLLFGILAVAIIVVAGIIQSGRAYLADGLSSRYLLTFSNPAAFGNDDTPEIRARALEIYNERVQNMKAEAKRLGIEFDVSSEEKTLIKDQSSEYLNTGAPSVMQAQRESSQTKTTTANSAETALKHAQNYNPKTAYEPKIGVLPESGSLIDMPGGKEDVKKTSGGISSEQQFGYNASTPELTNGWSYLDPEITNAFLLDKQLLQTQKNTNDIPIIAPMSKISSALGLPKLRDDASTQEKLERVMYIRQNAHKVTFSVCYRNSVSQDRMMEAARVSDEIKKNATNKDYQKPNLIYDLPKADDCAATTVQSDTRSKSEKELDAKQNQFKEKFGEVVAPFQQRVSFRVVGLSPEMSTNFSTVSVLASTVLGSSLYGNWVIPLDLYDAMPDNAAYKKFLPANDNLTNTPMSVYGFGTVIEFNNSNDMKRYYSERNCQDVQCAGQPYLMPFGSNSLLVDQVQEFSTKAMLIAGAIIGGIAALISMGIVGRVLADSRRETAVFRAIGASRNDIRIVYTIYTFIYSLIIAAIALAIGLIGAIVINNRYSQEATAQALTAMPLSDQSYAFKFIGVWPEALLALVGLIVVSGFVSMLLPLARNLARNPIKDMRDE
ncbi:MAG: FtsX-like permease family protein [Chloroflexi bacterium]|nr:MAG: FtsX-like permease family protein [Chloroflexota bacterium]